MEIQIFRSPNVAHGQYERQRNRYRTQRGSAFEVFNESIAVGDVAELSKENVAAAVESNIVHFYGSRLLRMLFRLLSMQYLNARSRERSL